MNLPCSIKKVLLRRKPYFSVTPVTLCSVWLPRLQLVLSIMPLILRDFIKIIRYTGACSIFSAFWRLCKATQTFEICTWYYFLEKLLVSMHWKKSIASLPPEAWRKNKLLGVGIFAFFFFVYGNKCMNACLIYILVISVPKHNYFNTLSCLMLEGGEECKIIRNMIML